MWDITVTYVFRHATKKIQGTTLEFNNYGPSPKRLIIKVTRRATKRFGNRPHSINSLQGDWQPTC
ncbi:hypothetical protein BPOR_0838g00020 [Botrytis porri]|uniref:Uncharacterized protein n=1 Tax=Botrytis porri TaxID=87229 RepID=A0A4Z1KME8_9HELO|nr:hypothetical protein BPOR_0838g00020 [Botrytis porri]